MELEGRTFLWLVVAASVAFGWQGIVLIAWGVSAKTSRCPITRY
jgi:hypothetical protein